MDYNKVWSLINKENLSKRAAAKIANMSPGGFNPMMENKTMSVKTLELLASYFKKPISYFFEEEILVVEDSKNSYSSCRKCAERDGMIKLLEKQAQDREKLISRLYKEIGSLKNNDLGEE
jgi:transcriptional regulator with XRE-family HTH domain